jgi:hypothetical protein
VHSKVVVKTMASAVESNRATPSNCLETPHNNAGGTACCGKPQTGTSGKLEGMVKIYRTGAMGSQVLQTAVKAVHGCSSQTKWWWAGCSCAIGLRYSRPPPRGGLSEERLVQQPGEPAVRDCVKYHPVRAGWGRTPCEPSPVPRRKRQSRLTP